MDESAAPLKRNNSAVVPLLTGPQTLLPAAVCNAPAVQHLKMAEMSGSTGERPKAGSQ